MKRRIQLVIVGLVLISLSAAWFLTPLSEIVLGALRPASPQTRGIETVPGAWDLLNTSLNALNALFGAAGLYLAARGYRLRPPGS